MRAGVGRLTLVNQPSFSVHMAGWSMRMRPDWPCELRKDTQSLPLHVLMVLLADCPLHINQGTLTAKALAMSPHQSRYCAEAPCSSFST